MEFDSNSDLFNARYDLFQLLLNKFNVICCVYPQALGVSIARSSKNRSIGRIFKVYTRKTEVREFFNEREESFIVIISERLEDGSGLELLAELKQLPEPPLCLLLLTHNHRTIVLEAKNLGADAICLQSSLNTGEINFAVESLLKGQTYIDSHLISTIKKNSPAKDRELTTREVEILKLVSEGKTNTEIAEELYIASSTVREHIQSATRKLNARDRTSAAIAAYKEGYLH